MYLLHTIFLCQLTYVHVCGQSLLHQYMHIHVLIKFKKKLQPESPCIVHVLVLETLQVHCTCTYVDDNKNVRIRLKNILFEYTYTVKYLECRFRNQNQNDAILHCIKKHCYSGLIPSHILICASGHQVNLISYREKQEYCTRISYDTGSVFQFCLKQFIMDRLERRQKA